MHNFINHPILLHQIVCKKRWNKDYMLFFTCYPPESRIWNGFCLTTSENQTRSLSLNPSSAYEPLRAVFCIVSIERLMLSRTFPQHDVGQCFVGRKLLGNSLKHPNHYWHYWASNPPHPSYPHSHLAHSLVSFTSAISGLLTQQLVLLYVGAIRCWPEIRI